MRRLWTARPTLSTETLALLVSLYFAIVSSRLFWQAALKGQDLQAASTLKFGALLLVALVSLHMCLLFIVLTRRTARAVLSVLFVTTALATYFMQAYGVYLTPGMLRNTLHSEAKEAVDLLGPQLLRHLLVEGVAPAALLWAVRIRRVPLGRAAVRRTGALVASLCLLAGSVVLGYQDLAPLFRNQKEVRYLIAPANYLYSLTRALAGDARAPGPHERVAVGADAVLGPQWVQRRRPVLLVMVVGETARSANWGLNGYARQTTPALARVDGLVNFSDVTACGSDTETSVPCMFSAIGRRQYDEDRIRGSESLLHVLKHAGFNVLWRDNQTGCKGVCEGIPFEQVDNLHPETCRQGTCLDEMLLDGLQSFVQQTPGNKVVVLHQLGNHGPAYYNRYPAEFRRFTPTCDTAEIRQCTVEQIVNSYDNALLYTDHFLSRTIAFLKEQAADHDTALLYVSDHGESLGERGLFLHGIPYSIAPDVQTKVPMVLWLSEAMRTDFDLDDACIRQLKDVPVSHDHLFHTVLGLLQVETTAREPGYDLASPCRIPQMAHGNGASASP